MKTVKLHIRRSLWRRMVIELRRRGYGARESGAFLLGDVQGNRIKHIIPYDDLDPEALTSGIVSFHGVGFVSLWNFCAQHNMQVLADVHTHGGKWTDQSETDRTNPMIETSGHIALILPDFAGGNEWSLKGVGIFEYLGGHQWKKWSSRSGRVKLVAI
jgi:proteasome lid subunit RPN8/RPN11